MAIVALLASGAFAAKPEVRVRLQADQSRVEISGYGLNISPPTLFIESAASLGFHRVKVVRKTEGVWVLHWDHQPTPQVLHAHNLWVRGQMLRLGPLLQPTDFELWPIHQNAIEVIARLDLDDYLSGVLPAEMPISWPLEALKAQTIAARSYVLSEIHARTAEIYDVDSTIRNQVYRFFNDVNEHPEYAGKLKRAVAETRGQVLLNNRGHILKAYYSADCGCQSEDPRFVWGKTEALQSVKDPTCGLHPPLQWRVSLGRQEVRAKLLAALSLPEDADLHSLQIAGRTPSGRVSGLVLAADSAVGLQKVALSAQEFRRIFGFQRVQSADFSLHWIADQLEIHGQGSGHGVGLCQRGARSLAESGMAFRDILKLYYPKAHLQGLGNLEYANHSSTPM